MSLGGLIEPLKISKQNILNEFGPTPSNIYDIRLEIAQKLYCQAFPTQTVAWDDSIIDGAYCYDRYTVVYRMDNKTFVLFKSYEDSMDHMSSYWLKEAWDKANEVSFGWIPSKIGVGQQQHLISSEAECQTDEEKKTYWEFVKQKEVDLRLQYANKCEDCASYIQVIIDRRKIYDSMESLLTDLGYYNVNVAHGGNHIFQMYSNDLARQCQQHKAKGLFKLRNWLLIQIHGDPFQVSHPDYWKTKIGRLRANLHNDQDGRPVLTQNPVSGNGIYLF
jgi:hypothetical protein